MTPGDEGSPHGAWVAGVDGGGTRTRVLATDLDGRVLARVEGPASRADPARPGDAAGVVADLVAAAGREARRTAPAAVVWAGLSGAGPERTRAAVEEALARHAVGSQVAVGTDVEAAFHDAFGAGPGILLVAGTGSVARGRSEDGREARVGGWGSLLGDEGSGYAIGLDAIRRALRGVDGRAPATDLHRRVLEAARLERTEDLVAWASTASRAELAGLVPGVVATAAAAGDPVAAEVLAGAADDLEVHVTTLVRALGPWIDPPSLALAGGLVAPGGPLREVVEGRAGALGLPLYPDPVDAARGAAARAAALARPG